MEISSTANISIETLNDMIADNNEFDIVVHDSQNYLARKRYDVFEMLEVKRKIQEFLKDCPARNPNNPNSEKEIFAYIYTKLAYMVEYDDLARDIRTDASESFKTYVSDYLNDSSGLTGALCGRHALCSGCSETLRNLLAEKGIEAKYMSGSRASVDGESKTKSHAWNQVKLDGVWFNCDITNDRDFIIQGLVAPNFLKSNYEFSNYMKYSKGISPKIEPATTSVSREEQFRLIERFRQQIINELNPPKPQKKSSKFVDAILKKLHLKRTDEKAGSQYE